MKRNGKPKTWSCHLWANSSVTRVFYLRNADKTYGYFKGQLASFTGDQGYLPLPLSHKTSYMFLALGTCANHASCSCYTTIIGECNGAEWDGTYGRYVNQDSYSVVLPPVTAGILQKCVNLSLLDRLTLNLKLIKTHMYAHIHTHAHVFAEYNLSILIWPRSPLG